MKKKTLLFRLAALVILAVFIPSCSSSTIKEAKVSSKTYKDPKASVEVRVKDLLSQLTVEEKAGQMLQVERNYLSSSDIKNYGLGSLLSGGGSTPRENSPEGWIDMLEGYQKQASKTPHAIPLIYGVDAVHGHNSLLGAVIFPHNIGLGAANDKELMKEIADATSEEMLSTGITWNFAPCVAVAQDPRWGRYYESLGEDPQRVSELSGPYISEMQDKYNIAVTAKHYTADGGTKWGTGYSGGIDQGNSSISDEELRKIYLPPYENAVKNGAKTIMVSFSSINDIKCHANKHLIMDILKGEMKFKGFVVSDYNGIHQIPAKSTYDKVVTAVNSGIDMFMEADYWKQTLDSIIKAVKAGDIKQDRIDDAVSRILTVKFELGLFENPLGNKQLIKNQVASDAHKETAKKAVRESLVLLKNENSILPIKNNTKVFVSGPASNSVGLQCGGWTLDWQGNKRQPVGNTILDGFKQMASQSGGEIITDPEQATKADLSVVVIGEESYAEYEGDDASLTLDSGKALSGNMSALKFAYSLNKPTVVIMVSGRPRIVTDEIDKWNAFVEAWLPGSQGDAVAEVIYGKYGFKGKLPVTWPKDSKNLPAKANNNILFPYNFGL